MIDSRIAVKYATALFRAAKHADEVKRISDDFVAMSDLLRKNPALKRFLESPQVLAKDKNRLIDLSFKPRISQTLFSFLLLVIEKHRIHHLLSMAKEFENLVKEDQGIIEALLITARETDQKLLEQIRQELEKTTGKKVEMKKEIDHRLIGGIIIIVGGRVIDRSVRCQLNLLKDQMSALKVHESA